MTITLHVLTECVIVGIYRSISVRFCTSLFNYLEVKATPRNDYFDGLATTT